MTPLIDPIQGEYFKQRIRALVAKPGLEDLDVSIFLAASAFIHLFPHRKQGLLVGALTSKTCPGWTGPEFQFIIRRVNGYPYFMDLKCGAYTEEELLAHEAAAAVMPNKDQTSQKPNKRRLS
jgi:hypothetical protein